MARIRIYHNPRCSKSRQALRMLEAWGAEVEVIEYLETPLSEGVLKALLRKLGQDTAPVELVRTNEKRFKELDLTKDDIRSAAAVARLLAKEPVLMQRPILVAGRRGVIGRPQEKVAEFLDSLTCT